VPIRFVPENPAAAPRPVRFLPQTPKMQAPEVYEETKDIPQKIQAQQEFDRIKKSKDEEEFQTWYRDLESKTKLHPAYDYPSYFADLKQGKAPLPKPSMVGKDMTLPYKYAQPGHPDYFKNTPKENWTVAQTQQFIKENPPQTIEDEAETSFVLDEKKQRVKDVKTALKKTAEDLANVTNAAAAQTLKPLTQAPEFIYDLAQAPGNLSRKLLKKVGFDISDEPVTARNSLPDWFAKNNPLTAMYENIGKQAGENLKVESPVALLKRGDIPAAARSIALQALENAPPQAVFIASAMAGMPGVGLGYMGVTAAAQEYGNTTTQGKGSHEGRLLNSIINGIYESLLEQLGTGGILTHWSNAIAKGFGTKTALATMMDVGKTLAYSFLGEGNEELVTSFAQDFTRYATGVDPGAMRGSIQRAVDAGVIGGVSGLAMTAPAAVEMGTQSIEARKQFDVLTNALVQQGVSNLQEIAKQSTIKLKTELNKVADSEQGTFVGAGAADWKTMQGKFSALHDRKARTEVTDQYSGLRVPEDTQAKDLPSDIMMVGDVLDHPELYHQYPWLKDVPFVISKKASLPYYSEDTGGIYYPANRYFRKTDVLHEVQHAIQHREGFMTGGNSGLMKPYYTLQYNALASKWNSLREQKNDIKESFLEATYGTNRPGMGQEEHVLRGNKDYVALLEEMNSLEIKMKPLYKKATGRPWGKTKEGWYRRIGGEAEAYDTEERADMSIEERRRTPYLSSQQEFLKEGIVDIRPVKEAYRKQRGSYKETPPPAGKGKVYYRGGGEGSMPKGLNAKDIINYEQEELGNQDIAIEKGIDPSKVKSENLVWVTVDEESAKEYGDVTKEEYPNSRVIARDSQGGVLLEKLATSTGETQPEIVAPGFNVNKENPLLSTDISTGRLAQKFSFDTKTGKILLVPPGSGHPNTQYNAGYRTKEQVDDLVRGGYAKEMNFIWFRPGEYSQQAVDAFRKFDPSLGVVRDVKNTDFREQMLEQDINQDKLAGRIEFAPGYEPPTEVLVAASKEKENLTAALSYIKMNQSGYMRFVKDITAIRDAEFPDIRLRDGAKSYGLGRYETEQGPELWQEDSFSFYATGTPERVRAFKARIGKQYGQSAVISMEKAENGPHHIYEIKLPSLPSMKMHQAIGDYVLSPDSGIEGFTLRAKDATIVIGMTKNDLIPITSFIHFLSKMGIESELFESNGIIDLTEAKDYDILISNGQRTETTRRARSSEGLDVQKGEAGGLSKATGVPDYRQESARFIRDVAAQKPKPKGLRNVSGEAQVVPPPEPPKPPVPQTAQLPEEPEDAPSLPTIASLEQGMITAIKGAKTLRGFQEEIYTQIRRQRLAKAEAMRRKFQGEQGAYAMLGSLKGKMPRIEFESIRDVFTQANINTLFDAIRTSPNLDGFERIPAITGLGKLLGEFGGEVPTDSELAALKKVFPDLANVLLDNRPLIKLIIQGLQDVLNVPRALMASFDLSAPFRQGIALIGYPQQWVPAFAKMFTLFGSEKNFQKLLDSITSDPMYEFASDSGLAITQLGESLTEREERFMSNLAEKIPVIGKVVRGSGRAYVGFLDKLRFDLFKTWINQAKKAGIEVDARELAQFINAASGRGPLGIFEGSAIWLNSVFFSPRLMASRLTLLNPAYYVDLDPFTRKKALLSMFTYVMYLFATMGLSLLAGAKVGRDIRSADFGKIKIGSTRIDVAGGFLQYVRLLGQLFTKKIVSSTSGKVMTLGEGYKPLSLADIIMRFFEMKEAPIFSFITGLLKQKSPQGEPFNVKKEIAMRFVPMVVQDIYDLAKENPSLLGISPLGLFGFGMQTYESSPEEFAKFYTETNTVSEDYKNAKSAMSRGDEDLARKIVQRDPKIKYGQFIYKTENSLAKYRKYITKVEQNVDIPSDAKKRIIKRIEARRLEIVRSALEYLRDTGFYGQGQKKQIRFVAEGAGTGAETPQPSQPAFAGSR
jgi:hypothetical protein